MNQRPLLPALLTAVVTLAVLNGLIAAWTHRLPYYEKLEMIRGAHDPNLLFVGNSLLDSHLNESALEQAAPDAGFRPVNSALGASEPQEQLLLFDYATRKHPSMRTVVVGVYDFQLTAELRSGPADLVGNRLVGIDPRFPLSEVAAAYGFSPIERLEFAGMRALPLVANRANAWKDVELLRRSMESIGMPPTGTNSMGRVNDFDALEAGSVSVFDAQASAFLRDSGHFNSSFESMFAQAQRAGMKVVIVFMPMSPYHRQEFYSRPVWGQYLAAVETLAHRRGIRVIDSGNWIQPQQGFVDHLHMSPQGVNEFSMRLGSELVRP